MAPAVVALPDSPTKHGTSGVSIKYNVHLTNSQKKTTTKTTTKTTSRSSSGEKSKGEAADGAEKTGDLAEKAEQTPEQAFEASRISVAKLKELEAAVDKNRLTSRVLNAMKKDLIEYNSIKLKLVDKKITGDEAVLNYVAEDPGKDLKITVTLEREDGKWKVLNEESSGTVNEEFTRRLFSQIPNTFPTECAVIGIAALLGGFSIMLSFVAAIWIVVAAFRVSLPWGLVTLFLPGGAILFAILNFGKAKGAVFTWLAACAIGVSAIVGLVTYFAGELADLNKLQPIIENKAEEI